MPDQPAPDFEEARMVAETILADDTEQGSVRIPHVRRNLLARTVLALLSEREVREEQLRAAFDEDDPHEALERIRLILTAPVPDSALRSEASGVGNEPETGAIIPATESAQAEGERDV